MVFNSLEFGIFFIVFFFLYWFVFKQNLKVQNLLILTASYFFYCWWDWRFLPLLAGSSLVNYLLGIFIYKTEDERKRRFLIFLGLLQGLGILIFFKYYNFFLDSFVRSASVINIHFSVHALNLILPLGISFYTFRAISYLLDINSGKIKPTTDWVVFFSYLAFFPTLLAGPIDKATGFIPQLERKRVFNYGEAMDGVGHILWGLFKKIVIANNCAVITGSIFENYNHLHGSTLLIGAFVYIVEIYADFSGYSDMAIGFSRLLGLHVMRNFNYPFFAQNIADFWRRWHISLTSWMTEYVFSPLSFVFRNFGKGGLVMAILVNFIIVGLWHGANWTFIIFGFLHGCYFIPLIIKGTLNKNKIIDRNKMLPSWRETINIITTFSLVMITGIIFRSVSISNAFQYYRKLFSRSLFSIPDVPTNKLDTTITIFIIVFMFIVEWIGRDHPYPFANLGLKWPKPVRWAFYYCIVIVTFLFASKGQQFIYLQF